MAYQDLLADLTLCVDNKNTKVDPFLRASIVRQLKELSSIRTTFTEGTFSFTTTALQNEYQPGYAGIPLDIMEIDGLWVEVGTAPQVYRYPIQGPMPIKDVTWDYYIALVGVYPYLWAWHHGTLVFAPVTNGAVLVKGLYLKDATLDSASGNPIATTSTTATNPWFDRGYHVLRNAVLADYYLSILGDKDRAAFASQLANSGIDKLKDEWQMRSLKSAQAPRFQGDLTNPYWIGLRR